MPNNIYHARWACPNAGCRGVLPVYGLDMNGMQIQSAEDTGGHACTEGYWEEILPLKDGEKDELAGD